MKIIVFGVGKVSKKILDYTIKPNIELLFFATIINHFGIQQF
ncbi:hypothetical protein CIY_06070 [Butyrivibrio fibrisolvens 16/4]|nr:hypothetical protein CIY_06070 [Butyrivibrio fibrisolvens 16/4]